MQVNEDYNDVEDDGNMEHAESMNEEEDEEEVKLDEENIEEYM